jgi:DNA polymerase III subunit alpha
MDMRPTQFEHIVAAISLFRPGPLEYIPMYIRRMHSEEKIEYKHPKLEPILSETYGIIVYQEQIIRIASDLAGYSPGDADQIRKAVGKKIREKIEEHRARFINGAVKNGIAQDIEFFARYGFNKAHAADYAIITCQTAYLKAHYPIEYMTALLTVERNNTEKIGFLVTECRRMNTPVLPPDINHSEMDFSIESCETKNGNCISGIRFGLGAIKNVGEGPVQAILEARRKSDAFGTLDDFCRRVDLRQVNRRALESLIKAGAFDTFGYRAQLLAIVDRMLGLSTHAHRAADAGQMTLFGEAGPAADTSVLTPLPNIEEAPTKEKLAWEKELVGIYTSEHPLTRVMADLHDTVTALCGQITEDMANQKVVVAGAITYVRRLTTKKGDPMAFAGLEDLQGTTEVVIFPRTWKQVEPIIQPDKIVVVRGKVDASGKQAKIIADSITDQLTITQAADGPQPSAPQAVRRPQPAPRTAEPKPVWDVEPDMPPDDVWPEDAMPAKPVAPPREAVSAPAMPNGNGTVAADRQPTQPVVAPTAAVQPTNHSTTNSIPRLLRITLTRSGDHDKDVWLLSQAHQLLTRQDGHDRFVFRLTGGGNGPIEMDFPNHYTHYSSDLVGALEKMLGPGTVRVEMQT